MFEIVTPLGRLILELSSLNDRGVTHSLINESDYPVNAPATLDEDVACIKFSIRNFETSVPDGYPPISGALSVHVSLSMESGVEIRLYFSEDFSNFTGGNDSGEWLEAITLDNRQYSITIGTWDDEYLFSGRTNSVPARFVTMEPKPLAVSDAEDGRGLIMQVPKLFNNEVFSFPFHVAWSPYHPEKPSTWFAVGNE